MKNYHILTVKYLGPTNYKGSRIKISSERFENSVTIPYNHDFNNTLNGALHWLENQGFEVVGTGESKDHYYIITETFKSLK